MPAGGGRGAGHDGWAGRVVPIAPADFIRFATGSEGQTVIQRQGTVNVKDGAKLWPRFRKALWEFEKKGAS